RQNIFEDEKDRMKFIQTIQKFKDKSRYDVYAYCLMSNHVHLLLRIGQDPLEQVMRRICGSYVYWYNWKHERIGNLFQDRFKSEPVEDDTYFLTVLRYIHQNPLKAGLVRNIEKYKWSSYNEYINKTKVIDANFALGMFNNDKNLAIKTFIQFNNELKDDSCLDVEECYRITDGEANNIIKKVCKVKNGFDLPKLEMSIRNTYLKELKEKYSLSIRQIERLTGINRGIIHKA
ncbi:MAG: transposase, partial [Desulfotomaculaceae bacterium]|nr:transposase [Desulfotomaculaceae bacterium]